MRTTSLMILLCAAALCAVDAHAAMSASEIYRKVSKSIVTVYGRDKNGKEIAQGSGVVINNGVVASNCHVVKSADTAVVRSAGKEFAATLLNWDSGIDLCSFRVVDLPAPPVELGSARGLKVGDEVFAIGAPQGFDLTLSNGIVSGLRPAEGESIIQTTAAISPGSSGGGLFDSSGKLVGITTMFLEDSQQINFAVPVEWLVELPSRSAHLRNEESAKNLVTDQIEAWEKSIQAADPAGYARRKDRFYAVAKVLMTSVKQDELLKALKAAYKAIVDDEVEANEAATKAAEEAARAADEAAANGDTVAPRRNRWFVLPGSAENDVALDQDSFTPGESPEVWVRLLPRPGSADAKKGITQNLMRIRVYCTSREFTISGGVVHWRNGDDVPSDPVYARTPIVPTSIAEDVYSAVCK